MRSFLRMLRALPSLIIFELLNNKEIILCDLERAGYSVHSPLRALSNALVESKPFRSVFKKRVYEQSRMLFHLIKWNFRSLDSLELNVVSGEIGPGLVIWHGYSTVVFCNSIGINCSIWQNVTVGRGKSIKGNDIPTIGDSVNIYTGATVIGGITIGNNVDIGAGAVVVDDVPDNCVVGGVPAKVLRYK